MAIIVLIDLGRLIKLLIVLKFYSHVALEIE